MTETHTLSTIVVVGAGLAGGRVCEELRALEYDGAIVLLGEESSLPYDRPPLTKGVLLGELSQTDVDLGLDVSGLGLDVRPDVRATGLRVADRVVETTSGAVPFDGLVLATGATPVRLPGPGKQHVVRTLDDAQQLRDSLVAGARLVIIGGSWIGAETATAALARGCSVTCLEAGDVPLELALGPDISARLRPWWDGVDVYTSTRVKSVEVDGVELADGGRVSADVVLTAVGVRPTDGWLAESGLELDRGVVVDEHLAAAPNIVAVGDVAAYWSTRYGRRMRVEHWDNAASGATVGAQTLVYPERGTVHDAVPYFWSDQFGHKLQYLGSHSATDRLVVREYGETGAWTAFWLDEQGAITAQVTVGRPRDIAFGRRLIEQSSVVDEAALADPDVALTAPELLRTS